MMKDYRSRWGVYATDITVGGKRRHIIFSGLTDGGSYYATEDEGEIEALENDSDFGRNFFLAGESSKKNETAMPSEKEDVEKIKVESVTNITEAREYLRKEGVDYRKLNMPVGVAKQAELLGVEFPNMIL